MGDGGAMLIGLIIAILSLQFISSAPFSKVHAIAASPVIGFGFILLPMMDTLRVFSIRMLKGRSPFSPDRNHIHHLLLDRGISHRGVSFISVLICVFFIIVSYYLSFTLGSTFGIIALIALFYLFVGILYLTEKKSY
jgi:UDP-GlcNAc:undecaprenyl-phosphate GlcNAc-1-phosphate transferase